MKMKNLVAYAALALGVVAAPLAARAEVSGGDIYSIDIIEGGLYGGDVTPSVDKPLLIGQKVSIRVRLIDRFSVEAGKRTPWTLTPMVAGMEDHNELKLGLRFGEQTVWADYLTIDHVANPAGTFTDLYFTYTAKPGDLATPARLMLANGKPATSDDATDYALMNRTSFWEITNARGETAKFHYSDVNPSPNPDPTYVAGAPLRTIDGTGLNLYVQTIDFDDDALPGEGIWRTVYQCDPDKGMAGHKNGGPGKVVTKGGVSTVPVTLYLWSADETIAIPDGATAAYGDKRHVKTLTIPAGGNATETFYMRGLGAVGDEVDIYLSCWPTNIFDKAGTELVTRVKRRVRVVERGKPGVSITLKGKDDVGFSNLCSGSCPVGYDNYSRVFATMKVELNQVLDHDVTVDLKAQLDGTGDLDAMYDDDARVIGIAKSDGGSAYLEKETQVTIPAGEVSRELYVYSLSATTKSNTSGIKFTPFVDPTAHPDFDNDESRSYNSSHGATMKVSRSKPLIAKIEPGTDTRATVIAGADPGQVFALTILDNYMNEKSAVYNVKWSSDSGDEWDDEEVDETALNENGDYEVTRTYEIPGETDAEGELIPNTTTVKVTGLDGSTSLAFTFDVYVAEAKKIAATLYLEEGTNLWTGTTWTEGEQPKIRFELKQKANKDLYAFLIPQDEATKALAKSDAFTTGYVIPKGQNFAVFEPVLDLLDGDAVLKFKPYVSATPTFSGEAPKMYTGYASDDIYVTVLNKTPVATEVRMSGWPWAGAGKLITTPAAKNTKKTFRIDVADVAADLDATDPNEFYAKWTFLDGGVAQKPENGDANGVIKGNPANVDAEYTFKNASEQTEVRVQFQDKDMRKKSANLWTDPVVFYVQVLDQPKVEIVPLNGSMNFFEDAVKSSQSGFKATLSLAPSKELLVDLEVKPLGRAPSDEAAPTKGSKNGYLHFTKDTITFGAGQRETTAAISFFIDEMDGTDESEKRGFAISAKVRPGQGQNEDGVDWDKYYLPYESEIYVLNREPEIRQPYPQGTNEIYTAALNVPPTLKWSVTDVDLDMTNSYDGAAAGLTIEWTTSEGGSFTTNTTTGAGVTVEDALAFKGTGTKVITLTVTDKDGGRVTRSWEYYVAPSKVLTTVASGPSGGLSSSSLSSKYQNQPGIGEGRTYARGESSDGSFSSASDWRLVWNFGTAASAYVYGYGYKVGERDDGHLKGYDLAIDASGARLDKNTDPGPNYYPYSDTERDSYLYMWIQHSPDESGKLVSERLGTIAPEYSARASSPAFVTLPMELGKDETGYPATTIEAIFSKEYLPSDNLGDINQDGIPDACILKYGLGVLDPESDDKKVTGDDTKPITKANHANDDEDYLPASESASFASFIPGLKGSWVDSGVPFDAHTEIRGYGECLNDALAEKFPDGVRNPAYLPGVVSDRVYTDPATDSSSTLTPAEYLAWRDYAAAHGLDYADESAWGKWSPERPTDPTLEDTDDDGLPDGYEYFFWYRAHVGALEVVNGKTNLVYLTGRRYDPRNPGEGKIITSAQIEKIFDPLVPLDGLTAKTMDTDNDGLPDLLEFELGTNPFDFDTDGDGLSDGWEIIVSGTDPLKAQTTLGTPDTMRNGDGDAMAFTTPELELGVDNPVPVSVETFWSFALQDENGATDGKQWYVMSRDYYDYFTNNIETVMETNETRNTALAFEYSVNNGRTWVKAARIGGITTVDIGGQLHVPVDTFDAFTYTNDQNRIIQLAAQRLPKGTLVRNIEKEALPLGYYCIATNLAGYCFSTAWVYGKSSVDTLIEDDLKKSSGYGMLCVGRQLCAKDQKETLGDFAKGDKLKKARLAELPSESRTVAFIHYMVYQHYGFDPRTAWNPDMPLHPRWGATDKNDDGSVQYVENASRPARTREYAAYDEFLVLSFFLNNESVPLADVTADPLQVERSWTDIFTRMTTNPQGPMDELADFGDHFSGQVNPNGADTDSDGVPDGWELYVMAGPKKPGKFNGKNLPDPLFHIVGPDAFMGPWKAFAKQIDHTDVNSDPESGNGNGDNDGLTEWEEFSGTDTIPYYAEPWHANPVAFSTTISRPQNHAGWLNKFWPTDPWNADTDQDGISDEAESRSFAYGGDQADDGKSQIFHGGGLNPLTVDTDLDGLPDPWEVQYAGTYDEANGNLRDGIVNGMDGTVPDAKTTPGGVNRDYDNDGLENWQEYLTGTMLCWRYDDPVTSRSPVPTEMMCSWDAMNGTWVFDPKLEYFGLDPDDPDAMNTFWYNLLVNVDSRYYNPHVVYGMSSGAMYFTRVKNAWDIAYEGENGPHGGSYYFFYDHSDYIKHYILSPQPQHWALPYMMMFNVVPIQKYPCTDPRLADTDGDGMDDYYELFHGMNPLLGKSSELPGTGPCDIVAAAYGGVFISAYNDVGEAGNLFMMPGMASPMNFTSYPWLNGEARADPDGDDIRNQEESIMPMLAPSAVWHHTDPTPLWMTDSTYDGSLVNRFWQLPMRDIEVPLSYNDAAYFEYGGKRYYFYKFDCFARANLNVFPPIPARFTMFLPDHWRFAGPGLKNYMYSFEENEGFDTDHDGLNDFEELQGKMRPSSDPQYFDSPRRREAMYFPGKDAALQTLSQVPEIHPTNIEWMDEMAFLQYTVECWVKAEDTGREQTLVERAVCSPKSKAYDEETVRSNFRLGIRDGRWYTKFDTRGTLVLSCVEALGLSPVSTNWTHVAATFDGKSLRLYVNGTQEAKVDSQLQPDWGAHVVAVQENGAYLRSDEYDLTTILVGASVKTALEGSPNPAFAFTPQYGGGWSLYNRFFKGWIDEVRIWDGARSGDQIRGTMRTRFDDTLAKANRDEFWKDWSTGRYRYAKDGSGNDYQPVPELRYHWAFDSLPGAESPASVAREPHGYNTPAAAYSRPSAYKVGFWNDMLHGIHGRPWDSDDTPGYGSVYNNATWVPWIPNTVAHLPRYDGTTLDSFFQSEDFQGGVQGTYRFRRNAEPASRWTQLAYYTSIDGMVMLTGSVLSRYHLVNHLETPGTGFPLLFEFTGRHLNQVGDDLLPLGGAYVRYCETMWDGQGASTTWEVNGTDSDGDGLPDWWEEYARANWGQGLAPGETFGWNDPITRNGVTRTAGEWYLRDLANGATPRKPTGDPRYRQTADEDSNGIPDWWADLYGIRGESGLDDHDNDGLPNYVEYLLTEVFRLRGIVFDPTVACSIDVNTPDYFYRPEGSQLCVGEIFTDHDLVDDAWEDLYPESYASRLAWDAFADADEDGWSNRSENRYSKMVLPLVANVQTHNTSADGLVADYPIPTLALTLRYNGKRQNTVRTAPITVHVTTDAKYVRDPDAIFRVGATDEPATEQNRETAVTSIETSHVRTLGRWTDRRVVGTLTPGNINRASVVLEACFDPASNVRNWRVSFNGVSGPTKRGTHAEYEEDIRRYGEANVTPIVDSTGYTEQVDFKLSSDPTGRTATWIWTSTGKVFGTIDLITGEFEIDLGLLKGERMETISTNSVVASYEDQTYRIAYTANASSGLPRNLYLGEATTGHVREGKNTIVAWADLNGDGVWDVGEPYGMVRDVDVSWRGTSAEIELTDISPVTPRINLVGGGAGDGQKAPTSAAGEKQDEGDPDAVDENSDRGMTFDQIRDNIRKYVPDVWGKREWLDNNRITAASITADTFRGQRIRVVRWLVNDVPVYLAGVEPRVVLDKTIETDVRDILTEADFLVGNGAFDIDSDNLYREVVSWPGTSAALMGNEVTSMSYLIVVGEGDIGWRDEFATNAVVALPSVVIRRFGESQVKPEVVSPGAAAEEIVRFASPTFKWRVSCPAEEGYTAFNVQVMDGTKVIYDSDKCLLPPRDMDGVYSWTAPLFVGDKTPKGYDFENKKSYTWKVSVYNAKFSNKAVYSDEGKFLMDVQTNGYVLGTANVAVRYFGPTSTYAKKSPMIRVRAYTSPDFTGTPSGAGYVADPSDAQAGLCVTGKAPVANCRIVGLSAGSYYLQAFIDSNGNGVCDRWETQGYLCRRDGSTPDYLNPTPITFGPTIGAGDLAVIYLEDADTDADGLPDAWEYAEFGSLTAKGVELLSETKAGEFMVNPELTGALELQAGALVPTAGLAGRIGDSLNNAGFLALAMGAPIDEYNGDFAAAIRGYVSPELVDDGVRITSLDLVDGKVSIKVEAETETAGSAWVQGRKELTVWCQVQWKPSITSTVWTDLGDPVEITVGTEEAEEVDISNRVPEGDSGYFSVKLYKK